VINDRLFQFIQLIQQFALLDTQFMEYRHHLLPKELTERPPSRSIGDSR
jgi:hypothetical protein